jgi:hypothetical protein
MYMFINKLIPIFSINNHIGATVPCGKRAGQRRTGASGEFLIRHFFNLTNKYKENEMDIRNFPQVLFKSWLCRVVPTRYTNTGSLALMLKEVDTGESIATATINMVDDYAQEQMKESLIEWNIEEGIPVYIKDYSENQGMLVALQEAGIVSDVIDYYDSGYVRVPLVYVMNKELVEWYVDEVESTSTNISPETTAKENFEEWCY